MTSDASLSEQDAERIGPTAHYTAYVWHRLGLPHAEHFSTRQGAVLYWGFFALGEWMTRLSPRVPSMREYLEYRHRLMEAVVDSLEPGCVVELGAGLTRRAVTWAADRGVPGIEFDLPSMASIKRRRIAQLPASMRTSMGSRHEVHDADVLDPAFSSELAARIRGNDRPVVVAEGLLSYFDPGPRCEVLASVAAGLREAGGGMLVADLHTKVAQQRVGGPVKALRGAIRVLTRRRRALDPFADLDALGRALREAGFDGYEEVRPESHYGTQPRLARLRSPVHIIVAHVGSSAEPTLS
ncbi:MAG: class I SAM-dependent methyltransferase [Myxococcota bacterium]